MKSGRDLKTVSQLYGAIPVFLKPSDIFDSQFSEIFSRNFDNNVESIFSGTNDSFFPIFYFHFNKICLLAVFNEHKKVTSNGCVKYVELEGRNPKLISDFSQF